MTPDYFALLGEERRPWLDSERVKDTFHRLSRTEHPDQADVEAGADFARLNQAQATLRDPKARLRHLLELEHPEVRLTGPSNVPAGLADRFVSIHGLLRGSDALLKKKATAASALAKALLAREELTAHEKIERALEELATLLDAAEGELQSFDARWTTARPPDAADTLLSLYQRFSYLSRWTEQLRERLFQLAA